MLLKITIILKKAILQVFQMKIQHHRVAVSGECGLKKKRHSILTIRRYAGLKLQCSSSEIAECIRDAFKQLNEVIHDL